ncbi:hypothetical protein [Rufibacter psychrotolerans]|uniref:hypothetical protein n=1 Tax=Rufibacter psychrotolerans TaxID=2812556 RepID=UPI0019681F41|nr:hypothetical protein [Rufibacter sp. SYSU D00308]
MDMMDKIVHEVYSLVKCKEMPEDFPVESSRVSKRLDLGQEAMLPHYFRLSEEGLLKISTLHQPPLLYLTRAGLARAKRLASTHR